MIRRSPRWTDARHERCAAALRQAGRGRVMAVFERLRGSVRVKLLCLVLAPLMLGFPVVMGLIWY